MAIPTQATPNLLYDPGFLWIAAVGVTAPTNTVLGGVFTDAIGASFYPLGPTVEGSTLTYGTTAEPMRVAELFPPVRYATTDATGSFSMALADFTATNLNRAFNGGVAAVAATSGTGATTLGHVSPPTPGEEVRCALLWESTDSTVRVLIHQALQGGEVSMTFGRAPDYASIPMTFNMEQPTSGDLFDVWTAGDTRLS